jgi:SAM-dependent methyltransferase
MSDFYDPIAYDARAEGIPGDVDFFLRLAQEAHEAGHPVLELACGTGRVAIPIAREGVQVVGLDLSPAMLARAREKSAGLETVRWPERFGLVFIPYRSFQHMFTVADQLSCLGCIHRHLVPGGRLALNIFNPDIVAIGQWLTVRKGGLQRRRDVYTVPAGRAAMGWETREYRPAGQELSSTYLDEELDGEGAVISRLYRDLRLRYIFRFEMEHLLARAGFEIEALYGDFSGGPFEDTSPEMVWVARRVGCGGWGLRRGLSAPDQPA